MPYLRTPDVAMFEGADWRGYKTKVPNCSLQMAQRIGMIDPTIQFFFLCREPMTLTNPSWPAPKVFEPGDAVFFSGQPWWGSAPQCDGYVKNGMSVAYVGSLNPSNPILPMEAAQYTTAQGLNAVDVVSLFAANLNMATAGDLVRLAPAVPLQPGDFLAVAHDFYVQVFEQSVAPLQESGITVLLSFLNNWDAAGWSNFDPTTNQGRSNAWNFALQLSNVVQTYGFDGIDIDDEYAQPDLGIPASLAMVASMMRELMPDKIISKALWQDGQYFGPTYNDITLAQSLSYGWNMTYGSDPRWLLPPYVQAGMTPAQLAMGYQGPQTNPADQIAWLKSNGYAGMMVYAFENQANQDLMGMMVDDWCGPGNWNATG